jgi:thiosulfate dehydrogenase (quinone)
LAGRGAGGVASTDNDLLRVKDLALRAAEFSVGFVFFSAAWRRFVNMPAKLAITSPKDVANKLVAAAPGSPIAPAIHWLLDRTELTNIATYAMSVAEAAVGIGLMAGLMTRISAAGSALLNLALMLIFGWMGFDCLDEWTMAALGFAISIGAMLYGPGACSLDRLADIDAAGRLFTRPVAMVLTALAILFTLGFYEYYFGLVDLDRETPIARYRIVAETVPGHRDAATLYVNAGSSSGAAFLRSIAFRLADGGTVVLPADKIQVLRSRFEPWSQSGMHVDGLIKLRLGSMTEIAIPHGAVSGLAKLIDNPDQALSFR